MKIGDIQRFSLIDYPSRICATLFTQGCNFRCPYCHNPELVISSLYGEVMADDEVFSFLEKRRGKLDAVNITGGEPTLQPDLIEFIERIRSLGYMVKIDTNGSFPEVLRKLIDGKLLDYIAMDVKAPLEKYEEVTGSSIAPENIAESIKLIMDSGIDYEFRTTIVKSLLTGADIEKIGILIGGARCHVLQKFVPSKTLDPGFMNEDTHTDEEINNMKEKLERLVQSVIIR
ncbi:MAG: anaerobic ribonucleoside-triphosphate reductase activating protein [Thermodesulfobacteriota bacterium]|nr:anaerobic ribonucleoside-triphosphate reductase activating protein [Thermodesulfobacteriota bacterium]